jgi:hypothetical protein
MSHWKFGISLERLSIYCYLYRLLFILLPSHAYHRRRCFLFSSKPAYEENSLLLWRRILVTSKEEYLQLPTKGKLAVERGEQSKRVKECSTVNSKVRYFNTGSYLTPFKDHAPGEVQVKLLFKSPPAYSPIQVRLQRHLQSAESESSLRTRA